MPMVMTNIFRNIVGSIVLLLLVAVVDEVSLPAAQPVRAYITYALTTDFDFRRVWAPLWERVRSWPASVWSPGRLLDQSGLGLSTFSGNIFEGVPTGQSGQPGSPAGGR